MRRFPVGRGARATGIILLLAIGGCAAGAPDGLVARPAADAPPAQVTQTVIDAINARDPKVLGAVVTSEFADQLDDTWLQGGYLTYAQIGKTVDDDEVGAYGPYAGADVASVAFTFVAQQTDISLEDVGETSWNMLLVHQDGRWRAFDMGVG